MGQQPEERSERVWDVLISAALADALDPECVRRKPRAQIMSLKPRVTAGRRSVEDQRKENWGKTKEKNLGVQARSQLLFTTEVLVCLHEHCVTSGAGYRWTELEFSSVIAFPLPPAASYGRHNCITQAKAWWLLRALLPSKSVDWKTAVQTTVESCLARQRRIIICKTRPSNHCGTKIQATGGTLHTEQLD